MSGGISKAKKSSASVEWTSRSFKKINMGTQRSTAQVHPRLLTLALLERAIASGRTKFLQGKNGIVIRAVLYRGLFIHQYCTLLLQVLSKGWR